MRALCAQATSHHLNQCWLRSVTLITLYSNTRPQWVNPSRLNDELGRYGPDNGLLPDPQAKPSPGPMMTSYHRNLNSSPPGQYGPYFTDDIFNFIFLNENILILIQISLKFVPTGPINYIPALVQIMAWRRPGDKPLSESMLTQFTVHICGTRGRWGNLNMLKHYCIISKSILINKTCTPRATRGSTPSCLGYLCTSLCRLLIYL